MSRVSIIITTYRESAKPYLDLCVRSVLNLNYPREQLELVIVAPKSYAPEYPLARTVSPASTEYSMPHGLNFGIAESTAPLMFILNDDVILQRECLTPLVSWMKRLPEIGLLMPIGNDQQGRYLAETNPRGAYTLESLSRMGVSAPSLQNMGWAMRKMSALTFHDTLCLYAFMIRRECFAKVGPFDENLIGQDDIDYSLRTRQAGYLNAIAFDSLVWHAGGASNTLTTEQREKSMRIFNEKWGQV